MKEHSILFSAPMVRAVLADLKTQTRRMVKYPHGNGFSWESVGEFVRTKNPGEFEPWKGGLPMGGPNIRCPYGAPGAILWGRETWAQNSNELSETRMDISYVYRADGEQRALDNGVEKAWRPSIHMPRKASRITLKITEVRVERLKSISERDAIAEGVRKVGKRWEVEDIVATPVSAVDAYKALWEYINGRGSWAANPWVWCVSFERVKP